MTKIETATLCFKVTCIYAFIQAIVKVTPILFYMFINDISNIDNLSIISWFIEPISWFICGLVLWFIAPLLAVRIFKSEVSESISNSSLESIQITAFSLAGLYLIASVLPEFLQSVSMHYAMNKYRVHGESPLFGTIIISTLQLILGLWLLLGSRGLVNFIHATRRD